MEDSSAQVQSEELGDDGEHLHEPSSPKMESRMLVQATKKKKAIKNQ